MPDYFPSKRLLIVGVKTLTQFIESDSPKMRKVLKIRSLEISKTLFVKKIHKNS